MAVPSGLGFTTTLTTQRRKRIMDQTPFSDATFAENPEPRVPCILVLDISHSMLGPAIEELTPDWRSTRLSLLADSLAAKRVEVAILTFGGQVELLADFRTVDAFEPPTLVPRGNTPMGAAINRAIEMIQDRKKTYREHGIGFYRPWIFLITDGSPTDEWHGAAERVKQGEAAKAFSFFAVGVEGPTSRCLREISTRDPLKLKGLRFSDLFRWLSNSQQSVSRSCPAKTCP